MTTKFQCELWLSSWNFMINFNIVSINHITFFVDFSKSRFWRPGKIKLKFSSSLTQRLILQYDILETFSLLPRFAVLHRIHFFHLDGFRGSGLKEQVSPQNKEFLWNWKAAGWSPSFCHWLFYTCTFLGGFISLQIFGNVIWRCMV